MKSSVLLADRGPFLLVCFLGIFLALSLPAYAALGGSLDSVQADQAHMKATRKITQSAAFSVHEMKGTAGTTVREYVSPEGRVFGVAWHGPFIPDMQQLLGSYFQQYSDGVREHHEARRGRSPLNIQKPGLVVQTSGYMRSYSGRAFDPGLLPSGTSAETIR